MADTRINALSTATSSVSDDYVPIDGTTNGTRKLSAYSPSFGGNATVGGTLTVGTESKAQYLTATSNIPSGFTANSSVIDFYLGEARFVAFGPDTSTKPAWKVQLLSSNGGISTDVLKSSAAGVISIPNTSASTSTSSGALVVSGGVGVAGALWVGGTNSNLVHANNPTFNFYEATTLTGSLQTYLGDVYLQASTTKDIIFRTSGSTEMGRWTGATKSLSVLSATASDATSTGALVISGGAGVAGAVNVGTFYGMVDGVTAPGTTAGYAKIYVDSADGDLKVKFGDGTVKTIATDS